MVCQKMTFFGFSFVGKMGENCHYFGIVTKKRPCGFLELLPHTRCVKEVCSMRSSDMMQMYSSDLYD